MSTIKLRRSTIQGSVPTTSALADGEVAINTYDGKLYFVKSPNGISSVVALQPYSGGTGINVDTSTGLISTKQDISTTASPTFAGLTLNGALTDTTDSVGTSGQVLQSTGTGVRWVSNSSTSPATTSTLGVVQVDGTTISVTTGGTISVANPNKLINGSYSATLDSTGTLTVDNLTVNALTTVNSQTLVVQGIGNLLLSEDGQYLTLPNGQPIASNNAYNVVLIGANTGSFYFTSGGKLQLPPSGDITDSNGNSVIHSPVVTGTLTDSTGSTGSSGYILQSTGTGVAWVTPTGASGAVSYFSNQGLTKTQQANARANIGLDDATMYFYNYMFG